MKMIKIIAGFVAACLVAAMGFVYSGAYNIGADAPHWWFSTRLLEALREHSIEAHAKGIDVPDLKDADLIAEGAGHYAPMCSGCHLAPGMKDTEIRAGLYPQPRNLAQARSLAAPDEADREAARRFWIIKHGIKMSAMPAWGTTHDDDSIWAMVAFLRRLPELSPGQYRNMTTSSDGHSHDEGGHDHPAQQAGAEQPFADESGHDHGQDQTTGTTDTKTDGHHHDAEPGHAHGSEETGQPHSH